MYLHCVTPNGSYTNIDLEAFPIFRMGLEAKRLTQDGGKQFIVLQFAYPASTPTGVNHIVIAAVDCKVDSETEAIVSVGLQYLDLEGNRKRLHEAAKSLCQVESIKKEGEAIATRVSQLADIYHGILAALAPGAVSPGGSLDAISGPLFKGEMEGYKFAVTRGRFESWRDAQGTMKAGVAPPAALDAPLVNAAPAMPLGAPPAPGALPPGPPRLASRESRRKAEAQASTPAPVEKAPPPPPATEIQASDEDAGESVPASDE